MTKRPFALPSLAVALAFLLCACSRSPAPSAAKDPLAELIAHTDRMIEILKKNGDDPEKAVRELAAYHEKNQAEVERLKQAAGEAMKKDPMKAAAASSLYGMRSAELAALTEETTARANTGAR